MLNKLRVDLQPLEARVMLAASVSFEELAGIGLQTADDLPDSVTLSAETSEILAGLPAAGESGAPRRNQVPRVFFGEAGEQIDVDIDVFGTATTESGDLPAFSATAAFQGVGFDSRQFTSGASDLGNDGEIALGGALGGSASVGRFVQVNDQTLFFVGTDEGRAFRSEIDIFGSEFDIRPLDLFAAEEIASELADAATAGSIGGVTVTPEEIQNATIQGLAVVASEVNSAVFLGETAGLEDGTSTLTRVDPSLSANLLTSVDAPAVDAPVSEESDDSGSEQRQRGEGARERRARRPRE